jgi:dTDP-glucose 4,6-dehydratase
VLCLDALTYAGNLENLSGLLSERSLLVPRFGEDYGPVSFRVEDSERRFEAPKGIPDPRERKLEGFAHTALESPERLQEALELFLDGSDPFLFVLGSVTDRSLLNRIMPGVDGAIHLAAETHVDRSILDPEAFVRTDVVGTYRMLESARTGWSGDPEDRCFLHVSTDEVYGQILEGSFAEDSPLMPSSPYSAAKTAADRLANSYAHAYGLPVVIVRPSNNFGPRQNPEKLIPLMTTHAIDLKPLPVYGDGTQVRDWLFVEDAVRGLLELYERGRKGEVYNLAGGAEKRNIDVIRAILDHLNRPQGLISFVKDRPAHDRRYSLADSKIRSELGFRPEIPFDEALRRTVGWYRENEEWWRRIQERDEEFRAFMRAWYADR